MGKSQRNKPSRVVLFTSKKSAISFAEKVNNTNIKEYQHGGYGVKIPKDVFKEPVSNLNKEDCFNLEKDF